jgi:hypothetical protein
MQSNKNNFNSKSNNDNNNNFNKKELTKDDYVVLLSQLQAMNYSDEDTNTPLKLLMNRVGIIPCRCTPTLIESQKFCNTCRLMENVNELLIDLFEDKADE